LASQWILRGFFLSLPADIDDVSSVDGCTHLQSLVRIVLPLSAPGLIAAAMFAFLLSSDECFYALAFLQSDQQMTLPIGIQTTSSYTQTTTPEDWIHLVTASVIVSISVFLTMTVCCVGW
jgi:multiple sugar transport system permease protein